MAHKKPKTDNQPDENDLLLKKVDEMMDVKGPATTAEDPSEEKPAPKSDVSEVAASINETLEADLKVEAPKETPSSAPELPGAKPAKAEVKTEEKPTPPESPVPAEEAPPTEFKVNEYDDSETNTAVDDITNKESDLVLAVEDLRREKQNPKPKPDHSGWGWVITIVLVIACIVAFLAYSGYGLSSLGL